jgi:hypothetical protein
MGIRVKLQVAEALGDKNRWFCSKAHGRKIDDPDLLMAHFVRSGGAADFKRRFDQAMGDDNRWYCSQFNGREIRDPQVLWDYYVEQIRIREMIENSSYESDGALDELSAIC